MGKEQRILGIGNGSFSAADPEQCSRNPGVLEGLNNLERSVISAERKGNRRFIAKYELQDEEGYRFSDKLQFYVMDLKAIDEAEEHEKENGLVDWAKAFTAKDWKAVEKIDNPGVKEAQKTMEVIMSEPTQRQLIIDRRTALLDRQAELDDATRKGRTEGRAEGRAEGRDQRSQEIYEHMIASGMQEKQARALAFG